MSQNIEGQLAQQQALQYQQGAVQDQGSVPATAAEMPSQSDTLWEFADIGFDTMKKLWFLQLFDSVNANVGFYTAKNIVMTGGCAIQYQWKDLQARPFWHVRERFLASEVDGFQIDMKGNLVINFKKRGPGESEQESGQVPKNFAYLQYAYHLTTKENGPSIDRAPMGFVEFCSQTGEVIGRLNNRWIIVEDVPRRTTGELPRIRIRVDGKDIGRVLVSRSSVIITGKESSPT